MSLYDKNSEEQEVQNNAPVEDPTGGEPQGDQGPNEVDQLLTGIKNERGEPKYANVNEALKGAAHAQEFINKLKAEQEELRKQLKSQEELVRMLKPEQEQEQAPAAQQEIPQGLTPEQVLELVEQREQQKVADSNMAKVKAAMHSQFGAQYGETLKAKTSELGLTPELVDNMAKTSPEALLKLFEVKGETQAKPSLKPSASSESFNSKPQEPKKFDPFSKSGNKDIDTWNKIKERTNARLGLN